MSVHYPVQLGTREEISHTREPTNYIPAYNPLVYVRRLNSAIIHTKSMAMGPSVRNLLAHYQLDPATITSTGPHQTLIKADVLSYINQHKLSPGSSQPKTNQPNKPYVPNLDISGYQPKPGPEGFSKVAKQLLDM